MALSDYIAHFGLEHHESSDNRLPERTLLDENLFLRRAHLLPHEFVHSWNGKYRRPADMVVEDFQQPIATNLLWVYEGLTTYLGYVLTARSGFWTPEQFREALAFFAEGMQNQGGRTWRPLEDTAVAAQLLYRARADWSAWRRKVDFYREGVLIWLEVDMLIRRQSEGRRCLDDFCRLFCGGQEGRVEVKPYTLDEIIEALNQIASYDWRSLLRQRIKSTGTKAPLTGVELSGWRLAYGEEPTEYQKRIETMEKVAFLTSSIGAEIKENGSIVDIIPGKAMDRAGLAPGMKIVAVNSRRWSLDLLRRAVRETKNTSRPLELLVENSGFFDTYTLDYHDGGRYPYLKRDLSKEDLLTRVIQPLCPEKQ
ncbi:MAG: hypothetical protein DRP79_08050 [Planctomycetota bacterium]|nr:MAG: hypothetical protein DRP79_08050 [Planctomycetota bacterium]